MNQQPGLTRSRAGEIASLSRAAVRRETGQFRIEGWRSVESALSAGIRLVEIVIRSDFADDPRVDSIRSSGCQILFAEAKLASRLSDVMQDQGIVAVADIPPADPSALATGARIVALDGVQDPGNLGTIVRCASWFGFDAVLAGRGTADFYNPKTVRSMAGAIWDVGLHQTKDLAGGLRELKEAGFVAVGADIAGDPVTEWAPAPRSVLVLGSEAHGMGAEVRSTLDVCLRIEGGRSDDAGIESLNVAVAAGILMHRMRV